MKMSENNRIRDWIQRNASEGSDEPEPRFRGRAYHRHFEGYSEFETIGENGKPRLERVYTGDWYTPALTPRQLVFRKLIYVLLWLTGVALLVFCASRRTGANNTWYCVAAQCFAIVGLVWTGIGMFNYMTVPLKRTVGDWRSSNGTIRNGSLVSAAAFLLSALTSLVFLLSGEDDSFLLWLGIAGYLLGAGLMILLNRMESTARYIRTEGTRSAPDRSIIIN